VKRLLSKRVIGAFCVLLLVLYLLRPGAGWMRARVSNSISQAVGRNVQVGYVRLRFLPRPGFEIDDLLVRDNPAFGAEPLVRAPDVTAAVSLGALLRGRIEIARLSLSEPSLNLTRNSDGKWNLEDLIDRTSHSSLAPTGSARGIAAPGFPYIEASDARVNFKIGTEKTHFALTNAQLALWQDSENTWGARLQARPIRTDANLTDTGVVNVNGLWRRSAQVHDTPIQISFQWKQAQLGQVSKLVYGTEKAWRGTGLLSGTILGTPDKLKISADASTDNFRRQDVIGGGNLRLAAHCTVEYDPPTREVVDLDCGGPVGDGYVQAKGSASGILLNGEPFAKADLWLVANRAPAESIITLFQHAWPDFPSDVQVNGDVSSTIQVQRTDPQQSVSVQGSGSIDDLEVARAGMEAIGFGTVPFTLSNGLENASGKAKHATVSKKPAGAPSPINNLPPRELRADFGPINLASAKAGPLTAQATLTRSGYTGSLHGDASVNRILAAAKAVSLPTPPFSGDGTADVSIKFSGEWFSHERPAIVGTAHLHSLRAQIRGVNAPVKIVGADLAIDEKAVTVQNLAAETADASWHGSLRIPRPCITPGDCEIQFRLHADKLTASSLNNLLNPSQQPKAWYRFLSLAKEQPSYILQAKAIGKIAVDKLTLGNAACSHFTSDLSLDAGKLVLSAFKAECLDGMAAGSWKADFTVKPPRYSGEGSFDGFSLSTVAKLTHDRWVEGSGRADYQFKATGTSWQDLLDSADLTAQFNVSGGTFLHIVLTRDSSPLRAEDFSGSLRLNDRMISFHDAKLTSASEVYTVSGTASFAGALNLKAVSEAAGGYVISGTFAKTRVSAIPNAEASLKP
jgi:hypothetical protein